MSTWLMARAMDIITTPLEQREGYLPDNAWDKPITSIEAMMDLISDFAAFHDNHDMGPSTKQVEAGLRSLIAHWPPKPIA
jgi:hypothetical protein